MEYLFSSSCGLPPIPLVDFPLPDCAVTPAPKPILDCPTIAVDLDPPLTCIPLAAQGTLTVTNGAAGVDVTVIGSLDSNGDCQQQLNFNLQVPIPAVTCPNMAGGGAVTQATGAPNMAVTVTRTENMPGVACDYFFDFNLTIPPPPCPTITGSLSVVATDGDAGGTMTVTRTTNDPGVACDFFFDVQLAVPAGAPGADGSRGSRGSDGSCDCCDVWFYNADATPTTPYAVMPVTGVRGAMLQCDQSTSTFTRLFAVNREYPVPPGGSGRCVVDGETLFNTNGVTAATGDGFGPTPGQWYATKNGLALLSGYGMRTGPDGNPYGWGLLQPINTLLGKTAVYVGKNSLCASVNVYTGNQGSEAPVTGWTISAFNYGNAITAGRWVVCSWIDGQWYITFCETRGLLVKPNADIPANTAGNVTIFAGTPGTETTTSQVVSAFNFSTGTCTAGQPYWIDNDGDGWYIMNSGGSSKYIMFALDAPLASTRDSQAATVLDYWGQSDPGADVTVYNIEATTADTTHYRFWGLENAKGYAVWDDHLGQYNILVLEPPAQWIAFTLDANMSLGSADATVDSYWGGSDPGGSLKVYDPTGTGSGLLAALFSTARDGAKGAATYNETAQHYEIVACHGQARKINFQLTSDMTGSSATADVLSYSDWQDPGDAGTIVYDVQGFYARALNGAKGTAVYNELSKTYEIVTCDQMALLLGGSLMDGLSCTDTSATITSGGALTPTPFSQAPTDSSLTASNPFQLAGQAGAACALMPNGSDGWVLFQVQHASLSVITQHQFVSPLLQYKKRTIVTMTQGGESDWIIEARGSSCAAGGS